MLKAARSFVGTLSRSKMGPQAKMTADFLANNPTTVRSSGARHLPRSNTPPVPKAKRNPSTGRYTKRTSAGGHIPSRPSARTQTSATGRSSGGARWGRRALIGGAVGLGGGAALVGSNTGKGSTPGNQSLYRKPPPGMSGGMF